MCLRMPVGRRRATIKGYAMPCETSLGRTAFSRKTTAAGDGVL